MKGIYIHIPFCVKKCNYCDFASYPKYMNIQDEYVNALIKEIKERKGEMADTVYIGGGTPSVLSFSNTQRLLEAITHTFVLSENCEFTVEVNPATVDKDKARLYLKYGVNRISMGAQSFVDSELSTLGRIHNSEDVCITFELLRDSGFKNINLDLMYALPGQTMESLNYSIDKIISLSPEHISCYGLRFEEGTPFFDDLDCGIISECDEDTFADMYDNIRHRLCKEGYEHYEISNFCKNGLESRHNMKYWQDKDYIGFGLSASSKEGCRRYTHTADMEEYMATFLLNEDYTMTQKEQMQEFVILSLRVIKTGVDKAKFYKKFGVSFDDVFVEQIIKTAPYVINTDKCFRLRDEAILVSNSIMCEFMG